MELVYVFGGAIIGTFVVLILIILGVIWMEKPIKQKQLDKYRHLKISEEEAERIKRGVK